MPITKELASAIARNLVAGGYVGTTPEQVLEQLATPAPDRNIIGMFAHGMLIDNGIADDGTALADDEGEAE